MTTIIAFEDLIDPDKDLEYPVTLETFELKEPLPPAALKNLKTLHKLGILSADGIMSLLAQAPIDAINLAGTLMEMLPGGWAFSAIDFSMFRVLAKDEKNKQVIAALRVDLLQSDTLMALARNKNNQLVEFKSLVFEAGKNQIAKLHTLCDDAIAAGKREAQR